MIDDLKCDQAKLTELQNLVIYFIYKCFIFSLTPPPPPIMWIPICDQTSSKVVYNLIECSLIDH